MWRIQRHVEEEGLAVLRIGGLFADDLQGPLGEGGQHILATEAGAAWTFAGEATFGTIHRDFHRFGGVRGHAVVFDEAVGDHVE